MTEFLTTGISIKYLTLFMVIFAVLIAMILSFSVMPFADAIPCDDYERDNGKTICISESTVAKLMERGWTS